MAKAPKKSSSSKQAAIPAHPRVPQPKEIGELCADVYRNGMKHARQQGVDEQTVEQLALDDVRHFMAACIKQSKNDWKAYTKSTGVLAAFVKAKKSAKKKPRARQAA
ncbi:MAG: hypothetical protein ABIP38_14575 [Steroidobacteraceae bacterium]